MLSIDPNIDYSALPAFANKENREIDKYNKELEAKIASINATIEDNEKRTSSMIDHMKNVAQELRHTQGLFDARQKEIETENHMKQLSERETGRLGLEMKVIEKELAEYTDQINMMQNNVYRDTDRIDALRTELKLEQSELEEWLRVNNEKDEDNIALSKYTVEDAAKIKELSLQIEKLIQEVRKKKNQLSLEVTETQVSQIELDQTAQEFKSLHQDRQNVLSSWEQVVDKMKSKDEEIESEREKLQKITDEVKAKQDKLDEKQAFLDAQNVSNAETEKKIQHCDRNISKFRLEHAEANASMGEFQDEVEVLRNTLNKAATQLVMKRTDILSLKDELADKHNRLEYEKKIRDDTKSQLAKAMDQTTSLEAKSSQLQEIYKQEELKSKDLDREMKILKEQHFKKTQELFRLRQDEKNIQAEITGGEAAVKSLRSKVVKLDQESLKQQALLYHQEYQIQQLERKVRRAMGDRTDEEKEILNKKIQQLNDALEVQIKKSTLLQSQLKKSQDENRQVKRKAENLSTEKQQMKEEIDELNLYNDSATLQLNSKIREKEELMVEESILKLELRKLRGFLNARADEVFSLENRQIQLQLALEERTKEICIHKDMLRVQIKNAEEERYSANSEFRGRVSKVEKLKKRYEILMTQFAPEDGDEEHSQAYYVIKSAQRKEELQREGDLLDDRIRKAEKEVKALQNTLNLLNGQNKLYRASLHRADLNSKDMQHKESLEQQYKAAMDQYRTKRRQIQDLQDDIQQLEQALNQVSEDESFKGREVNVLDHKLSEVEKDLDEQENKLNRAMKQVSRFTKEYRKGQGNDGNQTLSEELDIFIKEIREVHKLIRSRIHDIASKYPDLQAKLSFLYAEAGLSLPPSRAMTRASHHSRTSHSHRDTESAMSFASSVATKKSVKSENGRESQNSAKSKSLIHSSVEVRFPSTNASSPWTRTPSNAATPSLPSSQTLNRGFKGKNMVRKPARPGSASSGGSKESSTK